VPAPAMMLASLPLVRHHVSVDGQRTAKARLARLVQARRVTLGMLTQGALSEATGISSRTIGRLERVGEIGPNAARRVEVALGWAPGSIDDVLAGGDPTPEVVQPGTPPVDQPAQRSGRAQRAEIRLGDGPDAPDAAGIIHRLEEAGADLTETEIGAAYEVLGRLYEALGPERFEAWVEGARSARRARRDAG
jgi:hypothetical protein